MRFRPPVAWNLFVLSCAIGLLSHWEAGSYVFFLLGPVTTIFKFPVAQPILLMYSVEGNSMKTEMNIVPTNFYLSQY